MNDKLFTVIHKFAEDREIDYVSAIVVGEQFGIKFKSEQELIEWKQAIDIYLKTLGSDAFNLVENKLRIFVRRNK